MSHLGLTDVHQSQDATPDLESFTGFGNSAAEAFIQSLAGMVNQGDVETMIRAQKQMLQRFEKTNEMLLNCNALSQSRLKSASEDFKRHVKCLNDMKKDLDYIFRKIRVIKQKLQLQFPAIYAEVQPQRSSLAEEAEDDTEAQAKKATEAPAPSAGKPVQPTAATKKSAATIEYVQMEEAVDNGTVEIENELIKRVCSVETANPNDSSDCTSEDTG
ncbi:kxDL motif-containing protein CG10681 [Drosophila subpulchrella]|uniref:kxDL motif-containing protein CG10681 n=1 Tax=Drosophila subpulchrella TaxID=1486046 RepID=UPI0018A16B00|nr:kxDL motif-containing protein CG10681 [Drosophila subpulchrella]XP_037720340.1 kxDL motif-containing protein CG10681 [Drosophila subpulchrella]XP_037720342.1 kxDL motif-containing protein CG10681 [Drosophila subpulchrella]